MNIPSPNFRTTVISDTANAEQTCKFMHDIVRQHYKQVAPLAASLQVVNKDGVLEVLPTLQNVYSWIRANIKYTKDSEHAEQLHSPARIYAQRYGDCDDMSILTGALLKNWSIPFAFRIVGYKSNKQWQHVFTVVNTTQGTITIDCVPEAVRFNYTPKYKDYKDFIHS